MNICSIDGIELYYEDSKQKNSLAARLGQLIRDFNDDSGATTVEFVLWVPVFMFILMITVDVSLLFLRQSNLWYVARDGARQASLHIITDVAVLKDYVETRGTFGGDRPTSEDTAINRENWTVRVVLRVPMEVVGVFGILRIGSSEVVLQNRTVC